MGLFDRVRSLVGSGAASDFEDLSFEQDIPDFPLEAPSEAAQTDAELQDPYNNAELFGHIAAVHAQPIKNFMVELSRGNASRKWIEICLPVMGTLIEGAESLELRNAIQPMLNFREALWVAQSQPGHQISPATRQRILPRYEEVRSGGTS